MSLHELAGKPAPRSLLANIPRLVSAYYTHAPDASDPDQRVVFGTSGHRGSSLKNSFNERHILAICQAITEYRKSREIDGRCLWAWIPMPSPKRRWPPQPRSLPPRGLR